jgi:hypothetical protein
LSFSLLLIVITSSINKNLVFSEENNYEDPGSVNQQNNTVDLRLMEIKYQEKNFSDLDIFGKKIYTTKKEGFEWFMNNHDPESYPYLQ